MGNTTSSLTVDEIEDLTRWCILPPMEIEYLFERFCLLDVHSRGHITYLELMRIPEFHSSPLFGLVMRHIEKLTDYNKFTFPIFLELMEIFSIKKDKKHRIEFLFKMFDLNNENKLCAHVLNKIGGMVNNPNYLSVLQEYDLENKGYLNYRDFKMFYTAENIEKSIVVDYSKFITVKETLTFKKFWKYMWGDADK